MNQACVGGSAPVPYSAVPVLPAVPAGSRAGAAVPEVTTALIMACRLALTAGCSGVALGCPGTAGETTSLGGRHPPALTAAATAAMVSGVTDTRPCPNDSAANSTTSRGVGKDERAADTPGRSGVLSPNCRAAVTSCCLVRRWVAWVANTVLHDLANAVRKSISPNSSCSKLRISRPLMFAVLAHGTRDRGDSPSASSAAAVTTLNVDPGG